LKWDSNPSLAFLWRDRDEDSTVDGVKINDFGGFSRSTLQKLEPGDLFINKAELCIRFDLDDHKLFLWLTGKHKLLAGDLKNVHHEVTVAKLPPIARIRFRPAAALATESMLVPGTLIATADGIRLRASFVEDAREGRDLGRIGVDLLHGKCDFYEDPIYFACEDWQAEFLDHRDETIFTLSG
jgi:hypothetical protein